MANEDGPRSAEEVAAVESLIQGRSKRTTAGRHMSALLNAEADDDLALLFEEVEDDNDFFEDADPEAGDEDDVLESSSDDDQGPNAQDDDFEGEKELQKETKMEEKKRKKQHQSINLQSLRKRVKLDTAAASEESAPRPKKKSERVSWLPTVDDGPVRSSSRRQTMQNKQVTHARLKDSEKKRVRLIATMEEAAKRKAHLKPREMTQEQRLTEAARVERHNSKSLNRWEEMEKKKAEERMAKIEALQNRRLEGPVMSYWSGVATWVNGRLTRVGKADIIQKAEKDEINRKKKKAEKEAKEKKPSQVSTVEIPAPQVAPTPGPENSQGPVSGDGDALKQDPTQPRQQVDPSTAETQGNVQPNEESGDKSIQDNLTAPASTEGPNATVTQLSTEAANGPSTDTIAGAEPPTEEGHKKPADNAATDDAPTGDAMDIDEKPKETSQDPTPQAQEASRPSEDTSKVEPIQPPTENKSDTTPQEVLPSAPAQATSEIRISESTAAAAAPEGIQAAGVPIPTPQEQLAPEIHMDQPVATNEVSSVPQIPPPPPTIEQTGRTLTVLENFDDKTAQSREYNIYFNAKKPPRLTSMLFTPFLCENE